MRSISPLALLTLLAGSPAFAAVPRMVTITVDTSTLHAKLANEVQDGIASEILTGLAEGFANVVKTKVELAPLSSSIVDTAARACEGAECLSTLAKAAKVDLVVQVKVLAKKPKKKRKKAKMDCTLSMIVARAVPDRDTWREQTECEKCAGSDIKHMASLLATTIAERIDIATPPPAPPDRQPVAAKPPAPAITVSTPPPAPDWYVPRALSIGAVAGGAALLGTGIFLLAMDGRGSCDLAVGQKECPRLYDTTGLGTGLIVGGGAVAVAGLVGLVWFSPGSRSSQVALGFTGSSISLRGAF
jgi:hypothetical protein